MHRKNSLVKYSDDHELLRTEGGMFEDLAWLGGCLEGLESVWSLEDKVFWAGGIYIRNLRGILTPCIFFGGIWQVSSSIGDFDGVLGEKKRRAEGC